MSKKKIFKGKNEPGRGKKNRNMSQKEPTRTISRKIDKKEPKRAKKSNKEQKRAEKSRQMSQKQKERTNKSTNGEKWSGNKMQPTNPHAHTYVNGTDVETNRYAVTQNTFLQ